MLQEAIENGLDIQIIDVREDYEAESGMIPGGKHIPMDKVLSQIQTLRSDIPVLIYCRSGKRAAAVTHFLTSRHGFSNVYCLEGGIEAYAAEVNPEICVYA